MTIDLSPTAPGFSELRRARAGGRAHYWLVGFFSCFVNALMLSGPIYMLQVYDRVLSSRSQETLLALSLLVAFLYGIMGLLDYARGRIMGRAGAKFQEALDRRVFEASLKTSLTCPGRAPETGLHDLEAIQRLYNSPGLIAIFDIPWTPVFLIGISLFHPWLGMFAMIGGAVLIALSVIHQRLARAPLTQAGAAGCMASEFEEQFRTNWDAIRALGMVNHAFERWNIYRERSLEQAVAAADVSGTIHALSRAMRLMLQSAILGLGAYLVLLEELSPAAMIVSSILFGRALMPVEQVIAHWGVVARALHGWKTLGEMLAQVDHEPRRTSLPRPRPHLKVAQLSIRHNAAEKFALHHVDFEVRPGSACGVIGPTGSGKSTLGKAIAGILAPVAGSLELGGVSIDQFVPDVLGGLIGYLPQNVRLFDGTVAQNIARLHGAPDAQKIVKAAIKAGAHKMILEMPRGYDTPVWAHGCALSCGQVQRIGLARAMFGDPVLLVLDEPNSNLDNEGTEALNDAIKSFKASGNSVLIMAHRPAAIEHCESLLFLEQGRVRAYGPKNEVLMRTLRNARAVSTPKASRVLGSIA